MTTKSYAEVIEEVASFSWQLMDEEQHAKVALRCKRYLGEVTSDGVKLTWERFGDSLGTSRQALKVAAQRADKGRSSTATPVEQRRLKSDFAKVPEAVRQAIVTQAIREDATLAQAVVADAGASSALRRAREPEVTPVTPPRDPWGQVENAMQSIDYRMRELARHAADVRWTDHRYDVLGEWIAEQRTALTALRANPEAPALRSVGSAS